MWRILVVEDDFDSRKLLIEILRDRAQCDVAANGAEACRAFSEAFSAGHPYDLILLDVAMPEVDGLQVLERLRAFEEERGIQLGSGVPIIMVTAHPVAFTKSFIRGCDDFIIKPVEASVLIEKIENKLERGPEQFL